MQNFAKRPDHRLLDSAVVCVLTHGEHGELYGVDDVAISVVDFVSIMNASSCPALAHKPKLFFIQACRGRKLMMSYFAHSFTVYFFDQDVLVPNALLLFSVCTHGVTVVDEAVRVRFLLALSVYMAKRKGLGKRIC